MNAVTAPVPPPPVTRKWYREPWPWLLMSGPALVVVAGIITAVIAFRGADGLVADDYYKQGLTVNRQIARDAEAARLGIGGEVSLEAGRVRVALRSTQPLPDRLTMRFAHPSRSSEDRIVYLAKGAEGHFDAPLPPLGATRWRAIVETADWRVSAVVDPKAAPRAELSPGVR